MTHQCLGLLDMLMSKEELSVQVAEIDCIEIHDMNLSEASKNQILEQFAANSTSSNHQDPSLHNLVSLQSLFTRGANGDAVCAS